MAIQTLNNGDTLGTQRGKLNNNFQDLDSRKPDATAVLIKTNTAAFTPTQDYHPSTKIYSDSVMTNWHSIYNPQGINADVFARANHTGPVDPDDVAQDASNRFVTDLQINSWDAKEPGIGSKGTAFNKNFGTGATDVAPGNHSHIKADVGLDQVDNTSDADKGVSNATQAALDGKVDTGDQGYFDFDNTIGTPTYNEGRVFYDPVHNAISGFCDVEGVVINYGFEFLIRVWNGTGATIPNGAAVRFDGVDAISKQANAVLAQADSFANSIVEGLATHDIPNNTVGYICNHGGVHDFDTTAWAAGDTLYLSDTTPGGMTNAPPPIVTRIGSVRISNVLTGTVYVGIQNAVIVPTLFGQLYDKAATMNLATSYQDIAGYTNIDLITLAGSETAGTLTVPNTGKFRLTFSCSLTVPTKATARSLIVRMYDVTAAAEVVHSNISIGKDTTAVSRSFSPPFNAIAGHVYKMQIWASEAITGVSFDDVSFDIQSIAAV